MRITTALTKILLTGLISVFFGVAPGSARVSHAVAAPRGSGY